MEAASRLPPRLRVICIPILRIHRAKVQEDDESMTQLHSSQPANVAPTLSCGATEV
jgi:hypothetical protein